MTRIYLHVYPDSELFKDYEYEKLKGNYTNDIKDDKYEGFEDEETDEHLTNDILPTIITGASKNHFCPLKSFLYTIHETIKESQTKTRIIVYDLGLSNKQNEELSDLQNKGYLTKVELFDWSKYPSFWNISIARGEYAWKPGMIYEISQKYPGVIIWLDSGTKVQEKFFRNVNKFLDESNGFVSPSSPGLMINWTHPGIYDYFNDDHTKYDNLPNCNGASIAFDTKRTQSLIDSWYECALEKDCIAPPGSSRANHRQDQTLLTYLAAREGRICDQDRSYFGFHIHDDSNCKKEIKQYESEHKDIN
ncbi:unnamed protein product [Rhizophagus irregularis]|uniref:Uncharacterized protein n=1 Tax=Rhizophagus irregularis TaxID=588596 RepID=A0A2N1P2L4_9GLOM|nr:hypothetical protein RhiirC2_724580 [Rhizophagus irregularis]CAB4380315.1 unnamed protein product [Rhizophagus irregularis]CAB5365533.1 unnamed protein product [Rhizophagus irregularis]